MKQLILFVIGFSAMLIQASKMEDRLDRMREMYEDLKTNCSMGSSLSGEELDFDIPETEDEKCLLACILEKAKILSDGGFSRKTMDAIASYVYESHESLKAQALEVNRKCEKELVGAKLSDDCELAGGIYMCIRRRSKFMRFKH